ncbi:MAG: hypothetical protein ACK5P7_13900 [Bdellovibrio sp.]
MKQELNLITGQTPEKSVLWEGAAGYSLIETNLVYREMAENPVQIIDPVEELSANMTQLRDLQARMRYMMREIRTHLGK